MNPKSSIQGAIPRRPLPCRLLPLCTMPLSPFYRRPAEMGHFSLDAKRCFHGDARQLRYYAPPPSEGPSPGFDLRDGYRDRYVKRDDSVREGLDHLLQWIVQNRKQLQTEDKGKLLNADFVTWRGHLTKVLTTPYESREGWLLAVTLFRGTLYISEFETEAARREREQRSEMLKELMYMGYKFEQYMCAGTPDGIPDPTGVVNTNEGFCTVIRSRLGSHSLLFSGEVDCTDPRSPSPQPPSCYVELKTSKVMHSPAQRRSFYRHKIIKWWAQSFLPGVSRIVAGYRGPDGSVVGLETFETMKIFKLIRDDPGCWKPAVCMNFCAAFLAFLKRVVTEDNPKLVHLFAWNPGQPVSFTVHQDSHYRFLPDWYVEALSAGSPPRPRLPGGCTGSLAGFGGLEAAASCGPRWVMDRKQAPKKPVSCHLENGKAERWHCCDNKGRTTKHPVVHSFL